MPTRFNNVTFILGAMLLVSCDDSVSPPRVASVGVFPEEATLVALGHTRQFTATAWADDGVPVRDARFTWASQNSSVATVDPSGLVTAQGPGTTTIRATAAGIAGTASLVVDQEIDRIAFSAQPGSAVAGTAITPPVAVEVQDASGARIADAQMAVTLTLGANPGGATLSGTTTTTTTAGVATFADLRLDRAAAGYTLTATAASVDAVTSAPFTVTPAPVPPQPNSWVERASVPGGPLSGAVSFVVDDRLYVGTGLRNVYARSFYEYEPAQDRWRERAAFPGEERADAIAFAIGDYGYVGLGVNCVGVGLCTHQYFSDLWRYHPQGNAWARMADFPGRARATATSFVVGDKAYVTGGSTVGDRDLWEFDPAANSWTRKADYPGQCYTRGVAFSAAGKGYVGLGWTDGACQDLWQYDPVSNSWTAVATFPGTARYNAVAFTLASDGYIAAGAAGSFSYLTDVWRYSTATDTWTQLPTQYPGKGRSDLIAAHVAGRIFLGLGTNDDTGGPDERFSDLWEYTPPD